MELSELRKRMKQSAAAPPPPPRRRGWLRALRLPAPGIMRHPVFVPVMAGWGAALAGLSVAILPGALIASFAMMAGLAALEGLARPLFVLIAALLGAGAGLGAARALQAVAAAGERGGLASRAVRRDVRPIDPASELGSESFDAPFGDDDRAGESESEQASDTASAADAPLLEDEPFELDPVHELAAKEGAEPAGSEPEDQAAGDDEPGPEAMRREEVWTIGSEAEIDRTPPETAPAPEHADDDRPAEQASAIERLRQARTEDLSLVQLVERFAAALHDHQAKARRRAAAQPYDPAAAAARDAALAEALKTLSQLTESGDSNQPREGHPREEVGETERVLRDALSRLQDMRGAA